MPKLVDTTMSNLAKYRYVVLLGNSEADVQAGIASLSKIPRSSRKLLEGRYPGRVWGYNYAIVEFPADGQDGKSVASGI